MSSPILILYCHTLIHEGERDEEFGEIHGSWENFVD